METEFTHIRENTEDAERHLSENRDKFETDCMYLLRLMMSGIRLSDKTVMTKYEIHGRRLRELFEDGKCQKEWKLNENGKRLYVEYFIPISKPPTKSEVIQSFHSAERNLQKVESNLVTVFTMPDDKPALQQGNLFP